MITVVALVLVYWRCVKQPGAIWRPVFHRDIPHATGPLAHTASKSLLL